MIYSIEYLIQSVAVQLATAFPGTPVHDSPTQQKSGWPCFYIFLRPSDIRDQLSARDMRNISLDVVYVQERNTPDANAALYSVAETLDELLDVVPYSDGSDEDPVPLHTHEREYRIEDQELHYSLRITQRVSRAVEHLPMEEIDSININDPESGEYPEEAAGAVYIGMVCQEAVVFNVV